MEYVLAVALVGGLVYFLYRKVQAAKARREGRTGSGGGGRPSDYDSHQH